MKNNDQKDSCSFISSIDIKELKCLKNCKISFDKRLVAIMGVNGIGKSTILHALASCFVPKSSGVQGYKLSSFFPKSPNGEWKNSKFVLNCDIEDRKTGTKAQKSIVYKKDTDRWVPRSERKLTRDTYYINISTCTPAIDLFKGSSISFSTQTCAGKIEEKVVKAAAKILNKDYECLTNNIYNKKGKSLRGVKTKSSLSYSALSMGAGEQRLFSILETIYKATPFSLVLIDEIDLLLHPVAIRRLVEEISGVSEQRNLQVIFTTHSPVMSSLKEYVSIKYLDNAFSQTMVYEDITSLAWKELTGENIKPINIFVEDELAKEHVTRVASNLNMLYKVNVSMFGSASNAFSLAAAMIIRDEPIDNTIIFLDGDVYRTVEDVAETPNSSHQAGKKTMINKCLSGNESSAEVKREKALSLINQFNLPDRKQPEEFLREILLQVPDDGSELIQQAKRIRAVGNKHEWIDKIVEYEGEENRQTVIADIVRKCMGRPEWKSYVMPVYEWLQERTDV